MKKLFLLLGLLLAGVSLFAAPDIIQEPKERMDPNVFSIMPWGGNVSEGDKVDYETYFQDIYDCGFNVGGFLDVSQIKTAKAHNIMASVYASGLMDESIKDTKAQGIDWANKIKAKIPKEDLGNIYQIYVRDEPWLKDIEKVKNYSNAIKDIVGCRPYVNLMPDYAGKEIVGADYDEYCDRIIQGCGLDYVSYDNYSLFESIGLDEDRFYSNIEYISRAARKNKVIFVNIILSIAHFNYAEPNDYSIHVQGWSTLAYGGRGLSYFLLHDPKLGNYRGCAYDRYGSKTPLWYVIRNMNFAIHNLMPYYKDLEWINSFHIGNIPKEGRGKESAMIIKNLDLGFQIKLDEEPNVLVGEFIGKKDNKEYAIIVNKSGKYSVKVNNIEFNKGKKVTHISDYSINNPERDFAGEDMWLAPGHGCLLRAD